MVEDKDNGKWGYINKNGEFIIEPQFDNADNFSEGYACVELDGKWGYINNKGKFVIKPQFDKGYCFSEGLAAVKIGDNWGYIDKTGKYIINPIYTLAQSFVGGIAPVKDQQFQFHYIDRNCNSIYSSDEIPYYVFTRPH